MFFSGASVSGARFTAGQGFVGRNFVNGWLLSPMYREIGLTWTFVAFWRLTRRGLSESPGRSR